MASTGINVLRYSALPVGIFYGFYHQRTINNSDKIAESQKEYARREDLIRNAKKAWEEKNKDSQKKKEKSIFRLGKDEENVDVVSQLEKGTFDLEKFLASKAEA